MFLVYPSSGKYSYVLGRTKIVYELEHHVLTYSQLIMQNFSVKNYVYICTMFIGTRDNINLKL